MNMNELGIACANSKPVASTHKPVPFVGADRFESSAIEAHIEMLHQLAADNRWWADGKLVLFAAGEDPVTGRKESPRVRHFDIGDVDEMAAAAKELGNIPHLNVYAPWAVYRKDLPGGRKGSEADVVAVLALVADMDNDKGQGGALPLDAPYVIESSSGNFQAVYPLSRALSMDEAKPIAQALTDAMGCDHRTKDVSGVWRVPGMLNWPNKKKVARGRPLDPQPVRVDKPWTGELINPETLKAAVASHSRPKSEPAGHERVGESNGTVGNLLARCSPELRGLITARAEPGEDRSETAFSVIWKLMKRGITDAEIARLFEAHPEGIGERYHEGKDLKGDIRRAREKMAAARGSAKDAFPAVPLPRGSAGDQASDEPLPLFPPLPPSEPYPIEALGPVLSRAALAIANKVQVPKAIAAQSVLAAAALAAQAHADVLLPYGQTRPLSLYLVTVAGSGDRKSSADNEALRPVHKHEKALRAFYDEDMKSYRIEIAAWSAQKKKIEATAKIDLAERKQRITDLGPEPDHPLHPYLTISNLTIEGLLKTWVHAPAALGVFTAEGGQFTGGHGMSEERRLETAGIYSELWDGKAVKRLRALDGSTVLVGRRLSAHLMIQPGAAATFLANEMLRDQGLLSRVLVAAPDSIAGTRLFRVPAPADEEAIKTYGARILSLLGAGWPVADGKLNELSPRGLPMSDEAAAVWQQFHDHIEGRSGRGGDLRPIRDFAAKAAEHTARIAGVLTIIENVHATEIDRTAIKNAATLAAWYMSEALRLQRAARTDARLLRAQELLDWMQDQSDPDIPFRNILQSGPSSVRLKGAAEEALTILTSHGWVSETSARPRWLRVSGGSAH
jgi:hypothetical protein